MLLEGAALSDEPVAAPKIDVVLFGCLAIVGTDVEAIDLATVSSRHVL